MVDGVQEGIAGYFSDPDLVHLVEIGQPPEHISADFGIPCFPLARKLRRAPNGIAEELALGLQVIEGDFISAYDAEGPYLNIDLNPRSYATAVARSVFKWRDVYGGENTGHGQHVVIDMSSPNIAKQMSIGHLRSTIIGDSLAKIAEVSGFKVTTDNHIGDWGTQFGKLIYAIKAWGDEKEIEREPIKALQELYVKFHAEAEKDPKIEDEGRSWFKRLEDDDPEARRLWRKCVDWSMSEFQQVYDLLGVKFDVTLGESFYEPLLKPAVERVRTSGILVESKGALGVDLSDKGLGFAIVLKTDGATLYMTREIATGMYRAEQMGADQMVYVVGEDQKAYFQQYFEILRRLGYPIADQSRHVYFGMVTLEEGRMSTRKGRVILLRDVIEESIERAEKILKQSNPDLFADSLKRAQVARQVGIGALKWNDLSADPKRSIVFNWDRMLAMDGYSGPYIQYSHARAQSVLEKGGTSNLNDVNVTAGEKEEMELVKAIASFPAAVRKAAETYAPAVVATSLFEIAQVFNKFYHNHTILGAEGDLRDSRLALTAATAQVFKNGLNLLGIEAPGRM
ncbi:arginine--tRNA ligase [Candidatus Daviesbacteria bacterium RIFCSPHIGHO2_02_FULL_39_12]|uniref:Arginine--tRNA ligase n=2 Tax=Candidatus Daviesiibacteriota TaxID=1752718 RepID=A0A1F5JCU6_9BACT|nr:MAG: arginine--tRNA ligase [Candidatus Daviesbacteria bacterium RIFCSPHIGHO2_02_FULL_39_12]OGE72884.1 MAG: arginine--tRNA ligase [Candidatus Daviesbacteria bacterium RIFCSPLOWO2_02_FULL_38_15]